ncbi:MAG TPA: hypothetical protein VNI58_06330 [Mariprofundaceae bacterium]|nr:hypothetical protein [Mariprofundaceae bacterium]
MEGLHAGSDIAYAPSLFIQVDEPCLARVVEVCLPPFGQQVFAPGLGNVAGVEAAIGIEFQDCFGRGMQLSAGLSGKGRAMLKILAGGVEE